MHGYIGENDDTLKVHMPKKLKADFKSEIEKRNAGRYGLYRYRVTPSDVIRQMIIDYLKEPQEQTELPIGAE